MLFKGFLLGLALSAPIGVIGIWCIQRSIQYGFRYGLTTGLGATLADLCFAMLAAIGFTKIIEPWLQDNPWPTIIGATLIIYMGVQTLLNAKPNSAVSSNKAPTLLKSFLSPFLLIMTHPAAIFIFLGVFNAVGIGLDDSTAWLSIGQLLLGIFVGALCWWSFLSGLSVFLGKKMTPKILTRFNYISGVIVIVLGLLLAISIF